MGWRLRIEHTTRVRYAGPVLASFNEVRMTPLTLPTQVALDARVAVGPGHVPVRSYRDRWGTRVTAFDLREAHDCLQIWATAMVETSPARVPDPANDWDETGEAATRGRVAEFRRPTPLTTLDPTDAEAATAGVARLPPAVAAEMISARVRDRIAYLPGATQVRTSAQEAWDKGQGVCQDMAHAAVALLRAAGLPARYVSGYLHPDAHAEPGGTATVQGHAWAEYWAGEWVPLDPAFGVPVAERHVVVARGRDYNDVPPLKGVYRGPAETAMDVTIEVTRLA